MNPTAAGLKTLRTIAANGGEMNGYARQPGFDCRAVDKLVRDGHLVEVPKCDNCTAENWTDNGGCLRPLTGQDGGHRCYLRVRITDSGRAAIGETPTAAQAGPYVACASQSELTWNIVDTRTGKSVTAVISRTDVEAKAKAKAARLNRIEAERARVA